MYVNYASFSNTVTKRDFSFDWDESLEAKTMTSAKSINQGSKYVNEQRFKSVCLSVCRFVLEIHLPVVTCLVLLSSIVGGD